MTRVLYPGSFDPITKGHMNIIEQASNLFDEIVVAVMQNPMKKTGLFTLEERFEIIKSLYERMNNIKVISATGAAVDVAMLNECKAIIKEMSNNEVNTICLFADTEYQFVSSSMVKEVFDLDKDISKYVDQKVYKKMIEKRSNNYGKIN